MFLRTREGISEARACFYRVPNLSRYRVARRSFPLVGPSLLEISGCLSGSAALSAQAQAYAYRSNLEPPYLSEFAEKCTARRGTYRPRRSGARPSVFFVVLGFGRLMTDHSEIRTRCAFPCRLLPDANVRFDAFASETISARSQVLTSMGSRTRDWLIPEGSRAWVLLWIASARPSNRCDVSNSPLLGSASAGQRSNHNLAAFASEFCSSTVGYQMSAVAL
jgi:hypothetical protein